MNGATIPASQRNANNARHKQPWGHSLRAIVCLVDLEFAVSLFKNRVLLSVALGHLAIDLMASVAPVLVAFLSTPLGLSNAQVGLAATLYTVSGSLSQPFFGYLTDRLGGRNFALFGLTWMACWFGAAAFMPGYIPLVASLAMAGLGSGAYHPQGAMSAFLSSESQRGGSLSVWSLGGAVGFAMGPALAGILFETVGQVGNLAFGIIALPVIVVVARNLPRTRLAQAEAKASPPVEGAVRTRRALDRSKRRAAGAFVLLIVARSWAYTAMNTYIPKLYASMGHQATEYGSLLSGILMALAAGTFVGGFLADRIGKWRIVNVTLALATPLYLLFLLLPAPWNVALGVLAGFALGCSQSPTLVTAQELLPGRAGLASGLIMGFTFVTGALGTSLSGVMADEIGLPLTLRLVALLPLIAAALGIISSRRDLRE